jgi:hypothetical protein
MSQISTKFIKNNAVDNNKLAQAPANTIKGNNTGSTANEADLTVAQVQSMLAIPTSSSPLAIGSGGTGQVTASSAFSALSPLTTTGQIIYENATPAPAALNIGSSGQVLTVVAGLPAWVSASAGSVTSVALSDGSTTPIFNISGSPVTSSGTLTQTLATQAANTIFAGPTTGGATQPGFRSLVAADIPSLSATYVTQSQIGAINGVASLDSGGKVPLSQLPASLMEFKGSWDPTSNTPTLVDGTGVTGYTYWVSALDTGTVAGLTDPSMTNFQIGDLVIYNGTKWVLVTPAAGVQSVNGAQGAVTVNAINQLTGDATAGPASGSQSVTVTLATVNSNVGSFGSSTSIPTFTVNAKGLITAASGNAVIAPAGTLSGTTLNATVVSSSLTSVGTITSGTWNGTSIAIAHGGTGQTTANAAFNALSPMTTTGDIIYENNTPAAARLGIGSSGQVLTVVSGVPAWASTAATSTPSSEQLTLITGDITAQYVDLAHPVQGASATNNSLQLSVYGGIQQLKGIDYTVSLTGGAGGVTRITFAGDLATAGGAALVAGDTLMVNYTY